MKIIKRYNTIAVVFLLLTLFTACQRTELCYEHYPKASVFLEWEKVWERDYGMNHIAGWDAEYHGFDYDHLKPGTPEWVNVIRYSDNDSDNEHFFSPEGGDMILSEDEDYSFLLYNGDTEYIVLSDIASLPDARASATPRSRASLSYIAGKHPVAKSANPPDILYSAYVENIPAIKAHEMQQIDVKMQPLVFTYIVRYEFEKGLEQVTMARGALAGMAESVYLRDGKTSEEPIIILYDCDITDYGCVAHVRSFGTPGFPDEYYGRSAGDDAERPYTLNLEVLLANGTTLEFNFDVEDQLKNQPRGGVIVVKDICIENQPPPPPAQEGSGFDVGLSGWGEEEIDLPVNPEKR